MFKIIKSTLMILVFSGCSDFSKRSSSNAVNQNTSRPGGVFFTAFDPLATMRSGSLYMLSGNSGAYDAVEINAAEGSDPMVKCLGRDVVLINRSLGQQSFRSISGDMSVSASLQGQLFVGDPHDIVKLNDRFLFLSNYSQGNIALFDVQEKRVVESWMPKDLDLDLERFRGNSLMKITKNSENYLGLTHDALSFSNGKISMDGSQAFYLFKIDQTNANIKLVHESLRQGDLRNSKVSLQGSFPVELGYSSMLQGSAVFLSLCSRFMDGQPCFAGVEIVDSRLNRKLLWDLNSEPLRMNGLSVLDPVEDVIYANAEVSKAPGESFVPAVVRLDIKHKRWSPIYFHNPKFGGYWSLIFNPIDRTLLIGDVDSSSKGMISVYDMGKNEMIQTIILDHVPYSGCASSAADEGSFEIF